MVSVTNTAATKRVVQQSAHREIKQFARMVSVSRTRGEGRTMFCSELNASSKQSDWI